MTKIIIFGATGGTGQELVKQCISVGHEVSVFVHKNPEALGEMLQKVAVFAGDAKNYSDVNRAIVGTDAVLVAIGAIPGSKEAVLSRSTANIVKSMKENGIKRIVVETGAALVENRKILPFAWRFMSALPPMKTMFDDKRAQERILVNSGLDWIIVRPANLSNGSQTNLYRVGEELKLTVSSKISRADVAHFMIEQLTNSEWLNKPVMVTN